MPLHLYVDARGQILSVGPTLARVLAGSALTSQPFFDHFQLRRPNAIAGIEGLVAKAGARLYLTALARPDMVLRGLAVPMEGGAVLINLSFGSALVEAVRDHSLTEADFSHTDLAVELLYLVEAKGAIMDELRRLTNRLKGAKQQAEEQALTDTLTGLRNRRAMDATLVDLIARRIPFSMMHLDLDYFKQVNDTLGHAAGDALLVHVAQVLRRETRANDTLARVGGDEFVLLLPSQTDRAVIRRIGERLIAALSQPYMFEGHACKISGSIGVTLSTSYAHPEPDQMLSDADTALYASKHAGRGRVTVHKDGAG